MTTKLDQELDNEGYIKLPLVFEQFGYTLEFIKDLSGGWKIYKRTKKTNPLFLKYELVFPTKQEQFSIGKYSL